MYNVRVSKVNYPCIDVTRNKSVRFPPNLQIPQQGFSEEFTTEFTTTQPQPPLPSEIAKIQSQIKQKCAETRRTRQRNLMIPPIHPENYIKHLHWSEETLSCEDDTQQNSSVKSSKDAKLPTAVIKERTQSCRKNNDVVDGGENEEPRVSNSFIARMLESCGLRVRKNLNDAEFVQNSTFNSLTSTVNTTQTDDRISFKSSTSERRRFDRLYHNCQYAPPVDDNIYLSNPVKSPLDKQRLEWYVLGRRQGFYPESTRQQELYVENQAQPFSTDTVYDDGLTRKIQPLYYRRH